MNNNTKLLVSNLEQHYTISSKIVYIAVQTLQVLVWGGGSIDDFRGGEAGETLYTVVNPSSGSNSGLQSVNVGHDMFCPGVVQLANGNYLVVGGSQGGDGAGLSTETFRIVSGHLRF